MGFLKRASRKEDNDSVASQLEEQYERLYPKIGRDFVHRKDLEKLLAGILSIIDPMRLNPFDLLDDTEARQRALEYKSFLDRDFDGSKIYKDLIKLDEDDDASD